MKQLLLEIRVNQFMLLMGQNLLINWDQAISRGQRFVLKYIIIFRTVVAMHYYVLYTKHVHCQQYLAGPWCRTAAFHLLVWFGRAWPQLLSLLCHLLPVDHVQGDSLNCFFQVVVFMLICFIDCINRKDGYLIILIYVAV